MRPTLCYEKQAQTSNLAGTRKPSKEIGYQTLNTSMQMKDPDVRLPVTPLPRCPDRCPRVLADADDAQCLASHLAATQAHGQHYDVVRVTANRTPIQYTALLPPPRYATADACHGQWRQ
jgi:hypothetical protein